MNSPHDNRFRDELSHELADLTGLLNGDTDRVGDRTTHTPTRLEQGTSPITKLTKRFAGWRVGVSCFTLGALLSLIIHIILSAWIPTLHYYRNGIGVIWTGNCRVVSILNKLIHVGTTTVATLLLSGSNYCMQCLTAPTRSELQKAHVRGVWLDVGVQSIRNLRVVKPYKVILWFLLAISSIPIHLLYNSAFFMTQDTNNYQVYVVSHDFWDTTDTIPVRHVSGPGNAEFPSNATKYLDSIKMAQSPFGSAEKKDIGKFKRLSDKECIDAYAKSIITGRSTVIVTAANDPGKGPYAYGYEHVVEVHVNASLSHYSPYEWMCYGFRNTSEAKDPCYNAIDKLTKKPGEWRPFSRQARYCHSLVVDEQCALNANQPIMIVIIVCNVIKLAIMTTMVLWVRGRPIITLGDAIQSFLDDPDPTTKGLCLLSKESTTSYQSPVWPKNGALGGSDPIMARRRRYRWSDAASTRRWVYTLGMLGLSVLIIIVFFGLGIDSMKDNNSVNPFSIGFGAVDAAAVITYWAVSTYKEHRDRILAAVIVANLPQMIFSIITFSLNSLLTIIYTAQEWDDFSKRRKTLRVSEPKGNQRSTYFLQLPYRIAVPYIVATGVVSWLLSNSIFPIIISSYDSLGEKEGEEITCGFSPWPMVLVIVVGVVLIAGMCLFFFFRFVSTMPMVGTCSAAISAACHHDDGQEEVSLQPVKWGAVFVPETDGQDWVGHCCFTSSLVKRPRPGRFYAGKGSSCKVE